MLVAVCAVLSHFSCVCLFETPQAVACQAAHPLVILQARILAWVAMLSSRDLLNPGIEPSSPALQDDPLLSDPLVWVIFRTDSIKKQNKTKHLTSEVAVLFPEVCIWELFSCLVGLCTC